MALKTKEVRVCDVEGCNTEVTEHSPRCKKCGKIICPQHTWRIDAFRAFSCRPLSPHQDGVFIDVCEECKDKILEGIK